MVIVIIITVLVLLLLYPVRFDGTVRFSDGTFSGRLTLRPLFLLPRPFITLWDSEAPGKERKKKRKSEKEEKEETAEKDKKENNFEDLYELIPDALDILNSGRHSINRLPVRLSVRYSLVNPAHTAEAYGMVFAVLPLVFGDLRKLKWRIRIDPIWVAEEYCLFASLRLTVNSFLLLFSFAGSIKAVLKLVWKYIRRNKNERSSHRGAHLQRVGES